MDVQEELELFSRYTKIFKGNSTAVLGIASVHLASQLEKYLNPSLDSGWIIRCILDINSENLFSNSRETEQESKLATRAEIHPEYKHAELIIRLCNLFINITEGNYITQQEANGYILTEESEFYYGEDLALLNRKLLELACPELQAIE